MMKKNSPLLVAEGVSLTRDTRRILDSVSLDVRSGKLLAVIGPNGAGKSSLLSVMSGLWQADTGRIMLDGRDIREYTAAERARRCAVMRQDNSRPSGMTVLEAVEIGRLAYGSGGDESGVVAREMLRRMDLEDLALRDCARLSGGEWQRVAFARTLAQVWKSKHGGVLLLDEPVSSLDPAHQHHLLGAAREFAREGHAVLVILHDLNLTAHYADEVVLLAGGRVRASGAAADIMRQELLSEVYGCRVVAVEDKARGTRALMSLPSLARR
jgi:iron complex transport system ATP-binding protein